MKTIKSYNCKLCNHEHQIETNHNHSVYFICDNCDNMSEYVPLEHDVSNNYILHPFLIVSDYTLNCKGKKVKTKVKARGDGQVRTRSKTSSTTRKKRIKKIVEKTCGTIYTIKHDIIIKITEDYELQQQLKNEANSEVS